MPEEIYQPLVLPPGMKLNQSSYSQEGAYIGGDKVRWVDNMPEKEGGYVDALEAGESYLGISRGGIMPWTDDQGGERALLATHRRVYLEVYGKLTNITPLAKSGSLSNAFDTASGSATVTVTHTNHGVIDNTIVIFSNGTAIGSSGITLSGEYTATLVDDNTYTVTAGGTAASTETGAGSADYQYEINPGLTTTLFSAGYGAGAYGSETYGTPRSVATIALRARTWHRFPYSEDAVFCHRNGSIFLYDDSLAPARAAALTNAPVNNQGMFVTTGGHVIALGAGGLPMQIAGSDNQDITIWTPAANNDAISRELYGGSQLLAGLPLSGLLNLVWSDSNVFQMLYTADARVFAIESISNEAGLIGPLACITFAGIAYWMGANGFWMYDGVVRPMPNQEDVADYVKGLLNTNQADLCHAGVIQRHREIRFFFPVTGGDEIARHVTFMLDSGRWYTGTWVRTAWHAERPGYVFPMAADASGGYFRHENGLNADGAAMAASLDMAPLDLGDGQRYMDVLTYVPDMQRQAGDITITTTTRDTPRGTGEQNTYTLAAGDTEVDMTENGRQLALSFSSNAVGGDFRFGKQRLLIRPAGKRLP